MICFNCKNEIENINGIRRCYDCSIYMFVKDETSYTVDLFLNIIINETTREMYNIKQTLDLNKMTPQEVIRTLDLMLFV